MTKKEQMKTLLLSTVAALALGDSQLPEFNDKEKSPKQQKL
jgi:hypothetical protein